jgi:XTP/dITP diphosphohydrolase
MIKRLGFVTSNIGKLQELKSKLTPIGFEVVQLEIAYPEIQADTIDEVSRFGLKWVLTNLMNPEYPDFDFIFKLDIDIIFLEDSGLFVNGLNGFPGVYSKFVFKTIGYSGILRLLSDNHDRSAHFESCFGLVIMADKTGADRGNIDYESIMSEIKLFKGKCKGNIVQEPRGNNGFGYDPIFQAKGTKKTFAEMDTDDKNKRSHRGVAMNKFIDFLNSL